MSLLRSPTGSGINERRSESQPNLFTGDDETTSELSTVTFRNKRKHGFEEDIVRSQLENLQTQMTAMMELLTTSINAQNEATMKIKEDMASIKDQVLDIKKGMGLTEQKLASLQTDQTETRADVQRLVKSIHTTDQKLLSLESDFQSLKQKSNPPSTHSAILEYDELLAELADQHTRKKNIIIAGIQEPTSSNSKERRDWDRSEIIQVINNAIENCPEPMKIMRIGKYNPDKTRPIKASFEKEETVKLILRNKNTLTNPTIKVYSDQTPYQINKLKNLKDELALRISNGEENITIKYIKGMPKIVKTLPKNSETPKISPNPSQK